MALPGSSPPPLDKLFRGIDVAFFRSAGNDKDAFFVGFKGGDNKANHSHLDLGTFVLDALGQRWALDLGSDDYNLPGYFGKQRWNYYRLRTEGHNTLTIEGENQNPEARHTCSRFIPTRSAHWPLPICRRRTHRTFEGHGAGSPCWTVAMF